MPCFTRPPHVSTAFSWAKVVPIEQGEILVKAMSQNNMNYDLIIMEGAGHGFRGEQSDQARSAMVAWFDKHLSPTQIE